ncbi:MAG: chromate transporter [Verrucomicrobiota bacterium]|jgi:chromate transporter|nr:chromate transporter [Verrucomicrobiota bacterium]
MPTVRLHLLFWSFLRIGASTFGGGMAALPIFEDELVQRRSWLTSEETVEAYALAQSVPGVIAINFAVLAGFRIAGTRGAVAAGIAVALPSFLVILLLAAVLFDQWQNRWIAAALNGLRPAVIALIVAAALRLGRRILHSPLLLALGVGVAALMLCRQISLIPFILAGAGGGLLVYALRQRGNTP